jgi:hypothetical protein
MSSVFQRSYARDRERYPMAVGCLMWWGLFAASLAGYLVFFFIMSLYKEELGPSQLCAGQSGLCVPQNTILPIVAFAILFVSQLYLIYLVEAPKRRYSLSRTYGMLVVSMVFLPLFGTVIGLYLVIRLARDPRAQRYYVPESSQG